MSVMYFEYHPAENAISVYTDRDQRVGGMLRPHDGTHGIAFEAFKTAGAGKIKPVGDGSYMIMPARQLSSVQPT